MYINLLTANSDFIFQSTDYLNKLTECFSKDLLGQIHQLAIELKEAWSSGKQVFICGNGGSAANAIHMANDLHYGTGACGPEPKVLGLRVEALNANSAVITCLANDTGYENIYSQQLKVKGNTGDILIALSGSGNSKNIVLALEQAKAMGISSHAIVGFDGGRSKDIAENVIHFKINDMQIAEDTQLIIGHMCMQWLTCNKPTNPNSSINARVRLHECAS